MTNEQQVAILVSLLMPPVVAFVVNATWIPMYGKYLVAVVVSFIIGLVVTAAAGQLQTDNLTTLVQSIVQNFAVVLAAQQLAYNVWWKKYFEKRRTYSKRLDVK